MTFNAEDVEADGSRCDHDNLHKEEEVMEKDAVLMSEVEREG